ncbi:MAG: M55 family metallopeptidase, partial [Lachnospiraceae bacterium]|nr:M55 family metallopeptidase [Candidatus Hippenecus merdae]
VERSLRQDLSGALCTLPDHFVFEICYKEMVQAVATSYYPGFVMADDNTIKMETDNYEDILRAVQFVLK